jgi:hypothetical protein
VPKQYGDYEESVSRGLAVQDVFINSLNKYLKDYPGTNIRTSTLYEDKNKHIDVVCSRGNTTVKNYDNLDISVLVPYNDIIKISHSIIDKCTDI